MSNVDEAHKFAKDVEGSVWTALMDTIHDVFDLMLATVPVDTGFLQSKLYVDTTPRYESYKRPGKGPFEPPDPPVAMPLSTVYHFGDTAEYAESIEYGGHSARAPNGFIRVNLAKADDIFDKHLRELGL